MRIQPLRVELHIAALVACMLGLSIVAPQREAHAQTANGSLGVSLTILQPVATESVRLLGLAVDRAGMATIATTAPVSGPASQVIMTSVASSTSGFVPVQQAPALIHARGASDAAPRFDYRVDVGARRASDAARRPVQLRIQYLAVAGT